jgi:hypothetical protein
MKSIILNALKTRFEGVSDAILDRMSEKLAKTVTKEDEVNDAVAAITFQQVIESEADRRATDASRTAIVNYEKKHSLKEGKPVAGGGQGKTEPDKSDESGDNGTEVIPAWAKTLIDSNKTLQERLTGFEKEKTAVTRKQKLDTIISQLPENLRKPYGRINLADYSDEDFETLLGETKTEVEGLMTDLSAKGSVVFPPAGGGGNFKKEASKEEAAAVLNDLM